MLFVAGYDGRGRQNDEEDSACPALLEREFHSLHRNVPGLRRAGVDANAIRQVNSQPFQQEKKNFSCKIFVKKIHFPYKFTFYYSISIRTVDGVG